MRLVRIVLTLLLLAFGFLAAMFVMMLGLLARLFGRRPAGPGWPAANGRSPHAEARPVAPSFSRGEVIDIESAPAKE